MISGFCKIGDACSAQNIQSNANRVSPFCRVVSDVPKQEKNAPTEIYVDKYYGLAYSSSVLERIDAIYGVSEMGFHGFANHGFLRTPFRRVPRIYVDSVDTIQKIILYFKNEFEEHGGILLRGQTQEYYLDRNEYSLFKLYGDYNTLEPSLVTSASRSNSTYEEIYPSWSIKNKKNCKYN
jgi:hypothetical protein